MKKAELLRTEHQVQLNWLDNQIAKLANGGAISFSNTQVAERAYKKMKMESLIVDDKDIEHFMSVHLSQKGVSKLITTLRVYKKRNSTDRLQVEITRSNKAKLEHLVAQSGKTKIQIINQLIESADAGAFDIAK